MTIILFLGIAGIQSAFITTAAVHMHSPIMWTLIGVTYALAILVCYDYCYLTCKDPVDDLILKVQKNYRENELMTCMDCHATVHSKSYHCKKCNRCV